MLKSPVSLAENKFLSILLHSDSLRLGKNANFVMNYENKIW